MNAKTELSLQQFTETWWFRLSARSMAIVGGVFASVIVPSVAGYILWVSARVTMLEDDRVRLTSEIVDLGKQGDAITDGLADIRVILDAVRIDMATTKGIVTEMQRQDSVAATRLNLKTDRRPMTATTAAAIPAAIE